MLYILNANKEKIKVQAGDDVSEFLGVTKYEPPIPIHMAGKVGNLFGYTKSYDIDSLQKTPDVFKDGERVVVTEKLHGCIHRESKIMLPNGEYKTIENIIKDEKITHVLSYDVDNKTYIPRVITGKMCRENTEAKKWIKLFLENEQTLILTEDHPIFSRDRQQWIEAKNINDGEDIESPIL